MGRTVTFFFVQMQTTKTIGTMITMFTSCYMWFYQTTTYLANKAILVGLCIIITLFIISFHKILRKVVNQQSCSQPMGGIARIYCKQTSRFTTIAICLIVIFSSLFIEFMFHEHS